jgi:uncharacterized protein (TIGR02996 family)
MHTDADFLRTLLAAPSDNNVRLVYADWLDDQGDPESAAKAEFLRATAQSSDPGVKKRRKKQLDKRLKQLAAVLDTEWLAVVSRLAVENCQLRQQEEELRFGFEFVCEKRWEDMRATGKQGVRFCDDCKQKVHYCDTIMQARDLAREGRCIAVDLGIIRRENDLAPRMVELMLGMPDPSYFAREAERMKPDPVSAARERKKLEQLKAEASSET